MDGIALYWMVLISIGRYGMVFDGVRWQGKLLGVEEIRSWYERVSV